MHVPVLLNESIEALNIQPKGTYVDLTLGAAGHSQAILARLDQGRLIVFDQDIDAINRSKDVLISKTSRVDFIHRNFSQIDEIIDAPVDGFLMDIGVSSFQFDEADRGFSYRFDGPLDMRMDQSQTKTAKDVVNTYAPGDLVRILYQYAEEAYARPIVKAIVKAREKAPLETTLELVDIIKKALPQKRLNQKGHPAKQTFQALRIEVNNELDVLKETIYKAAKLLKKEGRLVIITFHSLEDRIVKQAFKELSTVFHPEGLVTMPKDTPDYHLVSRKPILPKESELTLNPRSKSAKMRILARN
jgi:16S rRNA (cytosine1402-N4)-methyltransferase